MKKQWLLIALAVAIIGTAIVQHFRNAVTPAEDAANINLGWLTDFSAAKARAQAKNKLLLINFTGSDWCPPCIRLRKEVFSTPEFARYAREYLVLLEADFPRRKQLPQAQQAANEALAEEFRISAFPTIVILNPEGKKLGNLGYTPGGPNPFIRKIEQLRR